jgi:hypothetical protein
MVFPSYEELLDAIGEVVTGIESETLTAVFEYWIERVRIEDIANGDVEGEVASQAVVRCFVAMAITVERVGAGPRRMVHGVNIGAEGPMYNMTKKRKAAINYLFGRQWHCCIVSNRAIVDVPDDFVLQESINAKRNRPPGRQPRAVYTGSRHVVVAVSGREYDSIFSMKAIRVSSNRRGCAALQEPASVACARH